MTEDKIILSAIEYVKNFFINDFSGHDYWHTLRVYNNAKLISKKEGADLFIVQISALLHDIDDIKISPNTNKNKDNAVNFMKKHNFDEKTILRICKIIDETSFSGNPTVPSTIEGKCVQDADRLDAIGAIGIARAFAYGGNKNRQMYNPNIHPNLEITKDEYRNSNSTTINHFYEKLFLLKDLMNTKTAIEIANKRHLIMENFIKEFIDEWIVEEKIY